MSTTRMQIGITHVNTHNQNKNGITQVCKSVARIKTGSHV